MKGKIRIVLLVIGGVLGGNMVDKNMNTKFPIFTIVLPLAAAGIAWRINSEMNESE